VKTKSTDTNRLYSALTKTVLCGASGLALVAAMPAYAQTAGSEDGVNGEVEEIVVTGIRQSLKSAQAIKQNADTFVDAITSEDIGALPDRSVTEALQRVPGVTISRFAAADDPDHFSIEGTDVVVRGLTYVASQFNGRETFSANNGRSLGFADVPPELLGSVQVFKNQTADLVEGGIAGTVSLETVKPFDKSGRVIAGSLEANYTDFRDEISPTISGLYSNRWDTDKGEFGLRVNAVSSELKSRSDGSQISSFQPRTDLVGDTTVYAPEGSVVRTQDFDRKRVGYGAAAQWASPDQTMEATAEFIRSEATTTWGENVSEIATDNVGDNAFFALPGTEFTFGGDDLFTSGSLSAPTGWRDDQWSGNARTPIYGLQSNNIKRGVREENITSDYSLNFKWTPNDDWAFNFDYQFVDSSKENVDFTLWGTTFQDVRLNINGDVPEIEYLTPPNQQAGFGGSSGNGDIACDGTNVGAYNCPDYLIGDNPSLNDPYNSFWRAAMDHTEDSEGTQNAFRADAEYKVDKGWVKDFRFGARYAERDQKTRFSTYNWGVLSEIWGNGGPVWMDEIGAREGAVSSFGWDDFQRGEVGPPPALLYYTENPATEYAAAADLADRVVAAWGDHPQIWGRLSEREGVDERGYLPGEIADVVEETTAFYGRLDFGHDNPFGNGITVDGNIGLRYVNTDVTSTGSFDAPPRNQVPNTFGTIRPGDPRLSDPDSAIFGQEANECLEPFPDPNNPQMGNQTQEPPGLCAESEAVRRAALNFRAGEGISSVRSVANNSYGVLLPSMNVKFGFDDDKVIRLGYSKGISRADVGLLRNYAILTAATDDDPRTPTVEAAPNGFRNGWYGFQGDGGNPFLSPTIADNYDISFEWYFDDVGSLTVSGFYKEIEDIIDSGSSIRTFTNNGVTDGNVFLVTPGNSPDTGEVTGYEIAHQQFYDDYLPAWAEGFGTAMTYTYVDSNGINSSTLSNTDSTASADAILVDNDELPLAGLSEHNYNASAIYEKGPISARLSYNWRSEYLVTPRDVITPFYPIFQDASGQLDGSFFYTINDNLKFGVQAANLLDTVTNTTSLLPNSDGRKGFRSAFRNDRRFTFALRGTF